MKAGVDQKACIGCGVRVDICPEVFQINGDGKSGAVDEPGGEYCAKAGEAAGDCPVEAIKVYA